MYEILHIDAPFALPPVPNLRDAQTLAYETALEITENADEIEIRHSDDPHIVTEIFVRGERKVLISYVWVMDDGLPRGM